MRSILIFIILPFCVLSSEIIDCLDSLASGYPILSGKQVYFGFLNNSFPETVISLDLDLNSTDNIIKMSYNILFHGENVTSFEMKIKCLDVFKGSFKGDTNTSGSVSAYDICYKPGCACFKGWTSAVTPDITMIMGDGDIIFGEYIEYEISIFYIKGRSSSCVTILTIFCVISALIGAIFLIICISGILCCCDRWCFGRWCCKKYERQIDHIIIN